MPPEKVAFLERGDLAQILEEVDENKSINFFLLNSAVEILPGKHTISVGYGDGSKRGYPYSLTFTARPNVRYVIKSDFVNSRWKPYIIEKESNKKVSETPINLIPMYGYPKIKKTEKLKRVDEQFIKTVVAESGSRKKSSKDFSVWGWTEMQKGNIDNAMRRFNQAWLLDPNYYQPYWGFGSIMLSEEKPDKAIAHFERSLELIGDSDNQKPRLLVDSARAYVMKADQIKGAYPKKSMDLFKIANSRIDKALDLDPTYKSAYKFGSIAAYLQGDYNRVWNIVKKSRHTGAYKFDKEFIKKLTAIIPEPNI